MKRITKAKLDKLMSMYPHIVYRYRDGPGRYDVWLFDFVRRKEQMCHWCPASAHQSWSTDGWTNMYSERNSHGVDVWGHYPHDEFRPFDPDIQQCFRSWVYDLITKV